MKEREIKSGMLSARIEPDIQKRLDELSKKTRISKSWYVCQALAKQMPEFERLAEIAA